MKSPTVSTPPQSHLRGIESLIQTSKVPTGSRPQSHLRGIER